MDYRFAQELIETLKGIERRLCDRSLTEIREMGDSLVVALSPENLAERDITSDYEIELLLELQEIAKLLQNADSPEIVRAALHDMVADLEVRKRPIKIAFFTHEFSLWPSYQTIWEACGPDVEKDLVLVYAWERPAQEKDVEDMIAPYREAGYSIRWMDEYDPAAESPDIVFYMKPYQGFRACPGKYYINEVEKVTPYTVFVSYCLDVQGGEMLQEFFYGQPFFYHVWRIIGYSDYYRRKMIERGYRDAENVVTLGHPKFDVAHDLAVKKSYVNPEWERKIRGRKVVLWNSHFTVEPGKGVGTYFRWKDTIFNYFRNHRNLVLLWRPHPLFWESVIKTPGVDPVEFKQFVCELNQQDNVIVDQGGDYRYSFCMSDALISDAATFLVEYSASGNPVLYTIKEDGERVCNDDYLVGMQTAYSAEDITAFLDGVENGSSAKGAGERIAQFEKIFGTSDGTVGKQILEYVLQEVNANICRRAERRLCALDMEDEHGME